MIVKKALPFHGHDAVSCQPGADPVDESRLVLAASLNEMNGQGNSGVAGKKRLRPKPSNFSFEDTLPCHAADLAPIC